MGFGCLHHIDRSRLCTNPCGNFDLNPHSRIGEPRGDHHCGWAYFSEVPSEHRPALLKVGGVWEHVCNADDIIQARASLP